MRVEFKKNARNKFQMPRDRLEKGVLKVKADRKVKLVLLDPEDCRELWGQKVNEESAE